MVGIRTLPPSLGGRQPFQPAHTGFAKAFGVGHDVRLRHRNEIAAPKNSPTLI